jgi:hypothetical protein
MRADERVQFAVPLHLAIWHCHYIGVMESPVGSPFDQACTDCQGVFFRESPKLLGRGPFKNRLGECDQFVFAEVSQIPIPSEATFREHDDLHTQSSGLFHEVSNLREIRVFVAGLMLELNGCHSNVSHISFQLSFHEDKEPQVERLSEGDDYQFGSRLKLTPNTL